MASEGRTDETSFPLLSSAQEYLEARMRRRAPDSLIVAAWQEFYRVYTALIRRFVLSCGVRDADVDDCVQDVWTEVAERLTDFERPPDRPGLRSWLYTIVRSKATNLFRRKSRRGWTPLDELPESQRGLSDARADPADRYERNWELALAHTLLSELRQDVSELNYAVVSMRLVEGRSVTEVAEALDLTAEQVRYRCHRMLEKLRARAATYTGAAFGTPE